jgi:hypothetical protein
MSDTDDEGGYDVSRIFDDDDDGETHPDYFSDLDDLNDLNDEE